MHTGLRQKRPSRRAIGAVLVALAAATVAVAQAANPGTATTGKGQSLTIRIDVPANGTQVPLADLNVSGIAGIGALSGAATNLIYVLDSSGSTDSRVGDCNGSGAADPGDDANGDGSVGDTLDCEIFGIVSLNAGLPASGVQAGVVAFGDNAAGADMSPAAGKQDFTGVHDDANSNARADVEDVARGVTRNGVSVFTQYATSNGGTNFDAALALVDGAFAAKSGQRNIVAFLSDGGSSVNTSPGSPLDRLHAGGITVNTFSVGSSGSGCAATSSMKTIADTTGGTCTEVKDPTKLTASLAGAAAGIKAVNLTVNGGAAIAATVTGLGNWTALVPAAALRSGTNKVAAAVIASDGTTVTADIDVTVAGKLTASSVIGLPSSKKCTSRRLFPIKIRRVAGTRYDFATVNVNGRRVKVFVRRARRWSYISKLRGSMINVKVFTAYVDLRGLAKGRYTVSINVVTTTGRIVHGTRKYRTCAGRLKGSVPRL